MGENGSDRPRPARQPRITEGSAALDRLRGDRSYRELASDLGISHNVAHRLCTGRVSPSRATLLLLAKPPASVPVEAWDIPAPAPAAAAVGEATP